MLAFAKKFGFDKELIKNYKIVKPDTDKMDEPETESILREINRAPGRSATPGSRLSG